jgi:NodT family efflux transporter outer membrane factor (OMF) lipoprotein
MTLSSPGRRWPLALITAALLAGCAFQGDSLPRAEPLPPQRLGLSEGAPAPTLVPQWWQALGDPALDRLVDQALRDQPDLRQAAARLALAQAAVQVQGTADDVHGSLSADVNRRRFSANGIYPPPLGGGWFNLGTLQAGASWEFDYFGRQRAALAAVMGQRDAAAAEVAAARLTLSAQIARGWIGLGQVLAQKAVLQQLLEQRDRLLGLIRQRVDAGLDTAVELRQGEGALPDARVQIEALDEQTDLMRHQLAALSGQGPDALRDAAPRLPTTAFAPPLEQLGLDLLAHRPEVQAARWRAEAAARQIDVARTDFYPDIRLSAFLGLDAIGLADVVRTDSRQFGVGAALHLPLFDGTRLRGQLRGKEAEYNAAVEQYNAAVLASVREAADALTSRASVQRQQVQQAEALRHAEAAYEIATQRYRAGLTSYLVVLSAETQVLNQRRLAIDLQARFAQSQVAVMKSLGGGWQVDDKSAAVAAVKQQ